MSSQPFQNPKISAIAVMDPEVFPLVFGSEELAHLSEVAAFLAPPFTAASLSAYRGDLSQVDAIFSSWGMPALDEELLGRLPRCKVVFHAAGTVRPFVTSAVWNRGVRVTSAASANAYPVADYTIAAITLCLKHAWQRVFELRERRVSRRSDATMPGGYQSTVGLLSLSRIGRKVAERLQGSDLKVIAYDPFVDPRDAATMGVELCGFEEVFARADVVSCHMPLLPVTTEVIRARHFTSMKPGASFVNTARGEVVCEADLISVFKQRADLFAVLDVVQDEPVAVNSPLLSLGNVVITPHIAGSMGTECRRMGKMMIDEARRFLLGQPLQGEVLAAHLAFTA